MKMMVSASRLWRIRVSRTAIGAVCLAVAACAAAPVQPEAADGASEQPRVVKRAFLRITAVGDIMLGGSAAAELEKYGYDYPFDGVRDLLSSSDIVFGNLEGPLTDRGQPQPDKEYVFRSPPGRVAPALAAAGFNIVSVANNHIMDYGAEGLMDTHEALTRAGIHAAGAGKDMDSAREPAILESKGQRVAILAYSLTFPKHYWAEAGKPGAAFGHEADIRMDVAAARRRADIVIVSFHWGKELDTGLREYQPLLAHAAIDAGASAVFGHHPHVLQGVELYRHGVIFYSLGNFAFGSYSANATRSAVAQLDFLGGKLAKVRLIPINVNNVEVVFQPRILSGNAAREVIASLQRLSHDRGTRLDYENGEGVLTIPAGPR